MSLNDKINKILKANKLGVDTPTSLEVFIGVSQGAITTPLRNNGNLGPSVTKKLHEKMRINPGWWETGMGEVFLTNGLVKHEDISTMRETFYRELMEQNEEYSVIPKAILKDYKIVPEKIIDMIYQDKEELKNALITKYEMIIAGMKEETRQLRSRLGEST